MRKIDGSGVGGIRGRQATSGSLTALVLAGRVTPPRRLDRRRVGHQRAERLQDADERERDQSSNHAFNVLPRPDPSSDRRSAEQQLNRAPRARQRFYTARRSASGGISPARTSA